MSMRKRLIRPGTVAMLVPIAAASVTAVAKEGTVVTMPGSTGSTQPIDSAGSPGIDASAAVDSGSGLNQPALFVDPALVDGTGLVYLTNSVSLPATAAGAPTPTVTPAARSASALVTSQGAIGDGKLDFIYDLHTGDMKIKYDGDTRINATHPLEVLELRSLGGRFLFDNFNDLGTSTRSSTLLTASLVTGTIPDGYDLGDVLPPGLNLATLTADLTLFWNARDSVEVRTGDIVVAVPEPASFGLIGLGAVGLLTRRRSKGARN